MVVAGIGILLLPSAAAATAGNFLMAVRLAALFMLLNRHDVHVDSAGVLLAVTSGAITSALSWILWYSVLPCLSSTMASAVQLSVPCLAVPGDIPEVRAVVTVGSPGEISHVKRLFKDDLYAIEKPGAYPVKLAGRTFVIRQQLVDDIQQQKVAEKLFRMNKPLLVFHAPEDDTVLIEQAEHIFRSARHPKSFISLHGADHLLSDNKDADYVGECIVARSSRYLELSP